MALVTDPVCGMQVDTATAPAKLVHGDHTHYFCSEACRDAFQAHPERYGDTHGATGGGAGMERHEPPFTVEGSIPAPKFGAAGSGGLEHEPIPEQHDTRDD